MSIYKCDLNHSEIDFKIKHLMISTVKGCFTNFYINMKSNKEDFSDASIECIIDVSSISTGISKRDSHLKSEDFFNCKVYPKIEFRGRANQSGESGNDLRGTLSMRGVKKDISLIILYNGSGIDDVGNEKFGFDVKVTIDRKDWDLTFNIPGGKNTLLIGDEVEISASIQMVKK